jgi:hypothetical protein
MQVSYAPLLLVSEGILPSLSLDAASPFVRICRACRARRIRQALNTDLHTTTTTTFASSDAEH